MMIGMPLLLFWPVHILLSRVRAEARMTLCLAASTAAFRPLRFALRELRGGLHGFRIFVACIALGVMAIAGVGSFSRSLTDGLAREGRVILGGDLAFSLIHREADADERRFLDRHGQVSAGATMRAMARTTDGRRALIELKAVDGAYPLYGTVDARSRHAARRRAGAARRRVRRRGRFDAAGAARSQARRAPDHRRRHHRDRRRHSRTSRTSSPAASPSARA